MIWFYLFGSVFALVCLALLVHTVYTLYAMSRGFVLLSEVFESMVKERASNQIVSWHVTYLAFIDHEARNVGVPKQERTVFGTQLFVGSQTLKLDIDGVHAFSPALLKDMAFRALNNPDVGNIELLMVQPMTARDVEADAKYNERRAEFMSSLTYPPQTPHS